MARDSSSSGILEWITGNVRPRAVDSAHLRFERMESQSSGRLPEVYVPLDPLDPVHWHHRGMIWDYVLSLEGAQRILDVGPGDGWPSLLLAPHFKEVVGIEPGPQRIAVCRANAGRMRLRKVRFEEMSVCAMDFPAGSFDGVVAATAIEQTPDPKAALREIHRVLRPGGVLRMSYEALEQQAEPVREAVSIRQGEEGRYAIDYVIAWRDSAEERGYLVEVVPENQASRKRLATWARRCLADTFPHRDPRLERGMAETVKSLRKGEIRAAQAFRIQHFKTARVIRTLEEAGFGEVRLIAGGGWPAFQIARELKRSRRLPAAAPLMEELCRGAARLGLVLETTRPGQVIARRLERKARRRSKR
ncbi:MAG: class I SAM-dependent methyltransferase [Candidatus Eisenbacteria sp.]|nr:class I SAM-dependent methyltransferase [Candidatus Eisenbacteria bacterium]